MTDRRAPAILRVHSLIRRLQMDRNLGDKRKGSDATGGRHRRWLASIAFMVTAGLILLPVVLLAVHDLNFQLEGDIVASTLTHKPTQAQTQNIDWSSLFTANFPAIGATKNA